MRGGLFGPYYSLMKTNRPFKFSTLLVLLGSVCAFATVAQAETSAAAKTGAAKTKAPKVTTETSRIGPSTEQVIVTEKYKDGTVIRVVQIVHQDGSSHTSGERSTPVRKI